MCGYVQSSLHRSILIHLCESQEERIDEVVLQISCNGNQPETVVHEEERKKRGVFHRLVIVSGAGR